MKSKRLIRDLGIDFLKNKTKKEIENIIYLGDGVYFLGEINGTNFITYQDLLEKLWGKRRFTNDMFVDLKEDEITGGNWLYFADSKYRNGEKTRFFLIAKKPILKCVPWNFFRESSCVYGLDILGPLNHSASVNSLDILGPLSHSISIEEKEYIARLPQGINNFSLTNNKHKINFLEDVEKQKNASEWDRTIVALVKSYLLQYDWLKDLNSEAIKDPSEVVLGAGDGQWTLCQEFVEDANTVCLRGSGLLKTIKGAANFSRISKSSNEYIAGYRPVLELKI